MTALPSNPTEVGAPGAAAAGGRSRRHFLRALAGIVGATAAAGAIETAAPEAAAASRAAAVAPSQGDLRLISLDSDLCRLIGQRDQASAERDAARERFFAICPPRPRELVAPNEVPHRYQAYTILEHNLGPELQNHGHGATERTVYDPEELENGLCLFSRASPHGRWLLKRLRLSEQFNRAAEQALERSGYKAAEAREEAAVRQIVGIGRYIFEIEPEGLRGIVAHARAISAIAEQGHSGMWVYLGVPAPRLVAALLALPAAA